MKYRLRRSATALAGALLASTALIAPAHAQSATSTPERFREIDSNGVDLVTGMYSAPFTEGKIGSGEGAVSIVRGSWGPDQWSGIIYRATVNGVSTMVVQLGPISDTFTQSGSSWVATKANGATLSQTANLGEWLYTAGDGTKIIFETIISNSPDGNITQPSPVTGPPCGGSDPGTCGIPTSITQPDRMVFHLNWDFVQECTPKNVFPCGSPMAYFRFKGVTSSAGFGFTRSYVTDNPGAFSAPQSDWFVRTGATFSDGTTVTYGSPSSGVTTITDTLGRTWTFTDAADGSTHIQRPGSSSDNIVVGDDTSNGTVTFVTTDGVTTNYSRTVDSTGATGTIVTTDPLGHTKTIVADLTIGRVTSITDENGHKTSYAYDSNGRLTKVTQPEGNFTQFTYDSRGNVTTTTMAAKAGSGLSNIVTSAAFDATCGNIVTCNKPNSTTDAKGNVTNYTYDATHGGVLTVTRPAPSTGAVRPQTRFSYTQVSGAAGDSVFELTGISECQTTASCTGTADETKVTATYNPQLLPATVTRANGAGTLSATTTITYDARGNLNTVDGPLSGAADTTKYRYDAGDQLLGVTSADPDGAGAMIPRAVRLTYRPDGQVSKEELGTVVSQTDAAWANFAPAEAVDVTFDANSRPVQHKLSSGTTVYALTQTSYDSLGRADCTAVRMSPSAAPPASACTVGTTGDQINESKYDPAGQITQQLAGVGTTDVATQRTMTYTNNGRVASLKDGENNVTTYIYDGFDRLSKTEYPSPTQGAGTSSTTDFDQLGYDANSNVTSRRLRDGTAILYTYDNLNRVTLKNLPGTEPDCSYAYDNLGRLLTAGQGSNNLAFTYDALGRELTETGAQGTVTSGYDLAGRRTSVAYPTAAGASNLTVTTNYLTTGEVSAILDGATSLATYAYDNLGNRTGVTYGNGVATSYAYDPVSRLTSLTHDLAGTANDLTIGTMTYNAAGQIVSVPRSNNVYSWDGAAAVNRDYTVNGLNQYKTAGSATFTYDARGNLTSDGTNRFGYSSENLLTSATVGGVSNTLAYDPMLRLSSVAGSATTRFAYDGTNLIADYDGTGALQHRYVFGPGIDEPIVEVAGTGARTWLSADERGSIVARTDSSGALVNANSYDEYGIPGSTNAGLFQYTGQVYLPQIGMDDYKNRFYSMTEGRFMQTDRIGYADGPNWYAYAHDDPVNLIDPLGLATSPAPPPPDIPVIGHCQTGSTHPSPDPNAAAGFVCAPDVSLPQENQVGGNGFGGGCVGDCRPIIVTPNPKPQQQNHKPKPTKEQCLPFALKKNWVALALDGAGVGFTALELFFPAAGLAGAIGNAAVGAAAFGNGIAHRDAFGAVAGYGSHNAAVAEKAFAVGSKAAEAASRFSILGLSASILNDAAQVHEDYEKCLNGHEGP